MTARIYVDLDRVHPVFDGRWHRAHLRRMPDPGEEITTLCGRVEPVAYGALAERASLLLTCWGCDLVYRRQLGIAVPRDHPGLDGGR
ncbi:zinc finger protein [Amycolatopsis sp. H20-H5]|uniref:zinc finger protein n=1 Tax=Amycolatopsis sp. H20-H5 TaxID=3046309 RepID=UPI002DBE6526|nr:zinc finger protein [Amycolatopsis sp. H20-H5]MEC3979425.1 zinc finger protein [Amycolatopsis sp. H20-H5]